MARKFGGRYSPGGGEEAPGSRFRGRRATGYRISARMMYAAPLPMLIAGIGEVMAGDAGGMLVELGAFALLLLSAILLNEGAGVTLGAAAGGIGLIGGLAFGAVAAAAQFLAFGLDPMQRKGIDGAQDFETDRVARAIDKAEETVGEILSAARQIGDRHIEARVEHMATAVREVFRTVEEDPRDLTRARKFLGVYLTGARDATRKFADLYARRQDQDARQEYVALLDDMEMSFKTHRDELLKDDKVALDVEIEVLRERLQREGV